MRFPLMYHVSGFLFLNRNDMEKMVAIYKLTTPNGKCYVGQTGNLQQRQYDYKNLRCVKQPLLYNSLKKYGWDAFTKEILEYVPEELADEYEQHYIEIFKCCEIGLNLTSGGNANHTTSESTRLKMSAANTGKKHRPISEEGKDKRSKALIERFKVIVHPRKGKAPWNKGKVGLQASWSKGKKLSEIEGYTITCPHCSKSGDKSNMKRYHFDSCKLKIKTA